MILQQALRRAREVLAAGSVEDPYLESELLLRHTLKVDRVQLYLEPDLELSPEQHDEFWQI